MGKVLEAGGRKRCEGIRMGVADKPFTSIDTDRRKTVTDNNEKAVDGFMHFASDKRRR